MKSNITKTIFTGVCAFIALMDIKAQSTTVRNGYFPTGKYIGFDNSNGINPLFLKTNATDRMVINGNKTVGINGYAGQVTNGFIGIGPNPAAQGSPWNAANAGPFSLLHLNSGSNLGSFGIRYWPCLLYRQHFDFHAINGKFKLYKKRNHT